MLTPSDITSTIGAGLSLTQARKMLRCPTKVIRHWARVYGIPVPDRTPRYIRTAEQWMQYVADHGPGVRPIARALGIDPKTVRDELDRYGISAGNGGKGGNPNWRKAKSEG